MRTYARWLFGSAAAFNLAVGAACLFLRPLVIRSLGLDPVSGSNIVLANITGGFVALFGYCYLLIAIDPVRYRPYISMGVIGKLLAVACVLAPWFAGEVSGRLAQFMAADAIFALLFLDYFRRTRS